MMNRQIVITETSNGFRWCVYEGYDHLVDFGHEEDCFQAFKLAKAAYDRAEVCE